MDKKSKRTQVEFERFYNDVLDSTQNLTVPQKLSMKTSFLNTFNKYSKVKVNSNDKNIIEGLYKNDKLAILRQDKGRGVVILNKTDYINKCEAFLNGAEFEALPKDPFHPEGDEEEIHQSRIQKSIPFGVTTRSFLWLSEGA